MLAPKKKAPRGAKSGRKLQRATNSATRMPVYRCVAAIAILSAEVPACVVPPQGQDDGLKHSRSPITTTNKPPIGKNRLQELPGRVWAIAVRKTLAVQFR